jgi:hypothetical protein
VRGGTTQRKKGRGGFNRSVLGHSEGIYEYRKLKIWSLHKCLLTTSKLLVKDKAVSCEIHFSGPST